MTGQTRLAAGSWKTLALRRWCVVVTIAFLWLMAPYSGAILWGLVAAIVFGPVQRRIAHAHGRTRRAGCHAHPAADPGPGDRARHPAWRQPGSGSGGALCELQTGRLDLASIIAKFRSSLPPSVSQLAAEYGLLDTDRLRAMLGSGLSSGLQSVATRALTVGQGALSFLAALGVMLYLTWFLLRDGERLGRQDSRWPCR